MTDARGLSQEILIRNISANGLGAACKERPVQPGERVAIELPKIGSIAGEVRWASGGSFGLSLDGTLDVETLDAAMNTATTVAQSGTWDVKRMHRVNTPPSSPGKLRRV